ncbi:MAG: ParA family protein [Leptospiraceae bacterium]|nr:ParA family protein [Leptospiraceae bacterium]
MRVLNFWNVKGGVGKSSLCYLTGEILRDGGKSVLFIDCDPQRSITKTILDDLDGKITLFDIFMHGKKLNESILSSKGFSIVPSSLNLLRIQESVEQNRLADEIETLKNKFDFILIDNQPTWNSIVRSSIQACDRLIMPSMISIFDLDEVAFSVAEARTVRKSLPISIVLNGLGNADKISNDEKDYMDSFLLNFKNELAKSKIPRSILVKRIIDRGESLFGKGSSKEKFRQAILNMVQEITESKIKLMEVA